MILESMYGQVEKENTSLLYEMLAGVMNKSLETDRQLWLLSGQVKTALSCGASLRFLMPMSCIRRFCNQMRENAFSNKSVNFTGIRLEIREKS